MASSGAMGNIPITGVETTDLLTENWDGGGKEIHRMGAMPRLADTYTCRLSAWHGGVAITPFTVEPQGTTWPAFARKRIFSEKGRFSDSGKLLILRKFLKIAYFQGRESVI